jgi:integrase
MPATRQGAEYPPKSGIIITSKTNPSGKRAWRVDISAKRTGGQREQKQFRTKEAAEKHASQRWQDIQSVGQRAFALTGAEREDAVRALEILKDSGLSLLEAVKVAIRYARPSKQQITLAKLRELFLAAPAKRRGKLIERRARSQGNQKVRTAAFVDSMPGKKADEITPEIIKGWLQQLTAPSPVTRNNYRRSLHAMFSFAVTEGYCIANPVAGIPLFAVPEKAPSILTVEQSKQLVTAAAKTNSTLGLLAYVTLGMFAGLRRAEIERLDWSAVKWERRMVTIDGSIAKTGSIRNVALAPNALEWLRRCPSQKDKVSPRNLNRRLQQLKFLAGIQNWEGNELRHSFASYHFDLHQNGPLTAAQLGHSSGCQLLFEHYRSLVPLEDGKKFFEISPSKRRTGTRLSSDSELTSMQQIAVA